MSKVFNESFSEIGCDRANTHLPSRGSHARSAIDLQRHRLAQFGQRRRRGGRDAADLQRPVQMLETLASLQRQQTTRRFAVIVMENEAEEREGATAATAAVRARRHVQGMVIVAHERGNCSAYNAGWQTAIATLPQLSGICWSSTTTSSPSRIGWNDYAQGGRDASAPTSSAAAGADLCRIQRHADWADHPVFAPPYQRDRAGAGRSIRRAICWSGAMCCTAMGPPFLDLSFNFMGGGDSDFLSRCGRERLRARLVRRGGDPRDGSGPPRSRPTGSARAACATASSRRWSRRRSAPARRSPAPRYSPKSLALLAASPFRGADQAGADRIAVDRALSRPCRARPRARRIRICQ